MRRHGECPEATDEKMNSPVTLICRGTIRPPHDKPGTRITIQSRGDEMKEEAAFRP